MKGYLTIELRSKRVISRAIWRKTEVGVHVNVEERVERRSTAALILQTQGQGRSDLSRE